MGLSKSLRPGRRNGERDQNTADAKTLAILLRPVLGDRAQLLSHDLIKHAGSFGRAVALTHPQLAAALGEEAAIIVAALRAACVAMLRPEIDARLAIDSRIVADYFMARLAYLATEQVHVLYLDGRNRALSEHHLANGTASRAVVHPRAIIKAALDCEATGLVLVHNHPSGDPTPSDQDIAFTRRVVAATSELDIRVHDHVVVARGGWVSFRTRKLL